MQLSPLALAALLSLAGTSANPPGDGEALREAARGGATARVRALLEAGVGADSPGRHGLTALMLAAERGHLEVVRLLLERGAAVDARETFFHGSALDKALGGGHLALARYLLEKGASGADRALAEAVERGDLELARAALARGVEPLELAAVRRQAERASPAVRELLAGATAARPARPPFAGDAARRRAAAGRYRRGDGKEATVAERGEALVLEMAGQPELVLRAVGPDRFDTAAGDAAAVFGGRADLIEWLRLNQGGEVSSLSLMTSNPQPLPPAAASAGTAAAPAPREGARPWPSFRGPQASGIGDGQGAPSVWSVAAGKNVRFKTPLPGLSLSSPIVWGDSIFVTSAVSAAGDKTFRTGLYGDGDSVNDQSEHSFRLYALDARTGAIRWEREAFRGRPPVKRHLKSSQANATPVTDGQRVIALFGMVGLLAAYDFSGKELWRRDVGVIECNDPQSGGAQWGHASSPILYRDLVIIQADRTKDSFLAAFKAASGEPVWRVARDEPSTWATPNVIAAASGDELVTNGQTIRGYDPASGRLLWTLGPNSEVVVGTPVVADGLVIVTAGYPPVRPVYAVRPGHRGDLRLPEGAQASAALAWSHARGGTYIPTPIVYRGHVYTVNNNGILTCYRLDDGRQVYQTRLPGASFAASPVAADGRLYFASETGEVYVVRAGPELELLATNTLDEVTMATPAISDGLLVVRTLGHVVGIAEGAGGPGR
jgi:outer membrane protein assembly factor BamB